MYSHHTKLRFLLDTSSYGSAILTTLKCLTTLWISIPSQEKPKKILHFNVNENSSLYCNSGGFGTVPTDPFAAAAVMK